MTLPGSVGIMTLPGSVGIMTLPGSVGHNDPTWQLVIGFHFSYLSV